MQAYVVWKGLCIDCNMYDSERNMLRCGCRGSAALRRGAANAAAAAATSDPSNIPLMNLQSILSPRNIDAHFTKVAEPARDANADSGVLRLQFTNFFPEEGHLQGIFLKDEWMLFGTSSVTGPEEVGMRPLYLKSVCCVECTTCTPLRATAFFSPLKPNSSCVMCRTWFAHDARICTITLSSSSSPLCSSMAELSQQKIRPLLVYSRTTVMLGRHRPIATPCRPIGKLSARRGRCMSFQGSFWSAIFCMLAIK